MRKFQEINLEQLAEWRKMSIQDLAKARECLREQRSFGDTDGVRHFLEEISYLQGRIDSYADVFRLARVKVPK